MSINPLSFYANPNTPLWASSGGIATPLTCECAIADGQETTTYVVGEQTEIALLSADTSDLEKGSSYLCMFSFSTNLITSADPPASLPTDIVPLLFSLNYDDGAGNSWATGATYTYDNTIVVYQQGLCCLALPFVLNEINPIYFNVYNPYSSPICLNITAQSECILQTSGMPTIGQAFVPIV